MVACSTGFQVPASRSRPAVSPGKPEPGNWPKPARCNTAQYCCGVSIIAILAAPTLLDFWMISVTVICGCGCSSRTSLVPTRQVCGVSITLSGWNRPRSSTAAATNGLMVEPGSKVSITARLRIGPGW